ncbi:MAG: hypothetical protein JW705_07135 [Methanosarcinaceae archaeon]|nr:hypothetical protein [Methanosarcinaceae archaeon]
MARKIYSQKLISERFAGSKRLAASPVTKRVTESIMDRFSKGLQVKTDIWSEKLLKISGSNIYILPISTILPLRIGPIPIKKLPVFW